MAEQTHRHLNQFLKGKRVLLLYVEFFGYSQAVRSALEVAGAEVELYDARCNLTGVEKAIRKVWDGPYRRKQRRVHQEIIENNRDSQYDFVFSNEKIDLRILRNYRQEFPGTKFILYLEDSVANLPGVEDTFLYYDIVATFDPVDAEKFGIHFRPLFYCDEFLLEQGEAGTEEYDVCFIGTIHSDRMRIINHLVGSATFNFFLYCYLQRWWMFDFRRLVNRSFRGMKRQDFRYAQLSLSEVSELIARSRAILDIQHPNQSGLTMRTIEAFGAGKKIVTTNEDIINYDFYSPDSVLIISRTLPQIPRDFINGESSRPKKELLEKYSIHGWVRELFSVGSMA